MKKDELLCEHCSLKDCKYVKPYFTPSKQHSILFVGQAPGAIETITGIPFTGPAGKMLWRIMHEAGIDKNRVDITNVAKCWPPEDRKPNKLEIDICKEFLKQDIHHSQPKLIVALGDVASRTLVGSSKIMSIRGSHMPLVDWFEYPCEVLCALHPSFVMRQRQWIPIAVQDMLKALDILHSPPSCQVEAKEPTFVTDITDHAFQLYLEEASKRPTAVDTETTGLNPREHKVIGASMCFSPDEAIAFDLPETDPKWEFFKRYLEDAGAPKITQNGQFDVAMLDAHGIVVEGLVFDTRLAEHLISSDLPGSLDFLRSKYTDVKPYKPSKKELKQISTWTSERRLTYGCLDALVTFLVYQQQLAFLDEGNTNVMQTIEIPLIRVINAMEKRGVLVDTGKLEALTHELKPKAESIANEHFAPIGVNPNSPKQLCALFDVAGTGEEMLKGCIKAKHKDAALMQAVLDYRGVKKTLSVYLEGVAERLEYGRIHTHYKIGGAGTGRLSSENPNLQNVPKDLRSIYIPDPGNIFVEADYSQLEVRVLAVVADEPTMISELLSGTNIHHNMAQVIFNKPWDSLSDKAKVWTKNVVFGTAYGRGPTAIARQFGISVREAEEWQVLCLKRYPILARWQTKQKQVFEQMGKCYTPFGRCRQIQTFMQALNTPIQASGSDVCLTSLIELHDAGFKLALTVHDSIAIQSEMDRHIEEARAMREIMERTIPQMNDFSFPVSVSAGATWKDLQEIL